MQNKIKNKVGRPRKNPDNLRVTTSFCMDKGHLDFIQKKASMQGITTSDAINILIGNIRGILNE